MERPNVPVAVLRKPGDFNGAGADYLLGKTTVKTPCTP